MRSWDLHICGSGFGTTPYDVAHNVFMTLSPDTRTGEDDVQLVVEIAMRPSPQQIDFSPHHLLDPSKRSAGKCFIMLFS